jgi:hypothetical protein
MPLHRSPQIVLLRNFDLLFIETNLSSTEGSICYLQFKDDQFFSRTCSQSDSSSLSLINFSTHTFTPKVDGVVLKSEETGEWRSGACGRAGLQSAREAYKAGKWDEALDACLDLETKG